LTAYVGVIEHLGCRSEQSQTLAIGAPSIGSLEIGDRTAFSGLCQHFADERVPTPLVHDGQ